MNTMINKAASAVSGVALFAIGCVMAGMGLAVVSVLALFALVAVGLAIVAAPFANRIQADVAERMQAESASTSA